MKASKEETFLGTIFRLEVCTNGPGDAIVITNVGGRIRVECHFDGSQEEVDTQEFLEALGLTERSRMPDKKLQVLERLAKAADTYLNLEHPPVREGAGTLIDAICDYRDLPPLP